MQSRRPIARPSWALALLPLSMLPCGAQAMDYGNDDFGFSLGGYIRGWTSFNLKDAPETHGDDKGKLSMLRTSLLLDADAVTGPLSWKAITRVDKEVMTDYQRDLQDLNRSMVNTGFRGRGSDLMDQYDRAELREFYFDYEKDRVKVRVGKQQVVWGETDFFRAMDVVQGFDYRWRSFLEPENEELRKPLIMVNTTIQVPEADGSLQVLLRPGLDAHNAIGNSVDFYGGRWAPQPYRGTDFYSLLDTDYEHSAGDNRKVTGGLRWAGIIGDVNYSLAWLKSYQGDPVVNSRFNPYHDTPKGVLGDLIYPEITVWGATASTYVPAADAVFSTELVYTQDAAFNYGSEPLAPGLPPGFSGLMRKDTFTTMLRMDKTVDLSRFLGTSRPSFLSAQLFNTRVLGFSEDDDLVALAAYTAKKKRDTTIFTTVLQANYRNDTINPSLAGGVDLSGDGGFLIPAVEFAMGDKWRLRAEADLFFAAGNSNDSAQEDNGATRLFGYFDTHDQLVLRLTRQF
ncbi:hypothetical protein SAMN05216577_10851 [Pseudomonas citronellolis]|uniref:LysR family transcriptional regulator n=2 Tax=Pseudomonas citronellolis TaxID=53408 RepID=A0AAQ1HLJ9_9PSED|nr:MULTISPECIES: DUF1302 family protein [Pseudomonas]MDI4074144.1 LysR family transcriptional regulator [Pseudomonas aeruginosa]MED5611722.1 DUF1302 family protein [Pseudomonas sp. JH-2]SFC62053.1 hypothetical protein SAMN05216577_10851 [Pseudomonas citronellolis]